MEKKVKILLIIPLILIILVGSVFAVLFIYDFPTQDPPKFVDHDWIELEKISSIGKYHSTLGHGYGYMGSDSADYSDKHYFFPSIEYHETDDNISIFAPVDGTISNIMAERSSTTNKQIQLIASKEPTFMFAFFHAIPLVHVGQRVKAGDKLGYCDMKASDATDLGVWRYGKPVSWFNIITDELFAKYQARGIATREKLIKTEEQAQVSTNAGYNFNKHDPCDIVLLKNTPRNKCLPFTPFNPENLTYYSYMPNRLIEMIEEIDSIKVSNTQWFHFNYSTTLVSPITGLITEFSKEYNGNAFIEMNLTVTTQLAYRLMIKNFTTDLTFEVGKTISAGTVLGNITADVGFSFRVQSGLVPYSIIEHLADSTLWNLRGIRNSSQYMLNNDEILAFDTKGFGIQYTLDSPWFIKV